MPDGDSSMRLSYPDNDKILDDLNRPSDEKRYKIVFHGDPVQSNTNIDSTPRRTLNFDEVAPDDRKVDRPFDISFSQSVIAPVNDSMSAPPPIRRPLEVYSGHNYLLSANQHMKNKAQGPPTFYQPSGFGKENRQAAHTPYYPY